MEPEDFKNLKEGIAVSLNKAKKRPNPKCKYCYGRGYIGIDIKSNTVVWCDCLEIVTVGNN